MFDFVARPLAQLLNVFYTVVPNYAAAIIMLTIVLMLVMTPLTLKQQRSMTAMQEIQPEVKRIQAKHKGDRQKANEEVMALYQERGVNPLAGCLPLVIQLPFFFAMFQVLRGLTRIGPDGNFDPKYLEPGQRLYDDLHGTDEMVALGMDLARSANDAVRDSLVVAIPYLVLVALSGLFAWFNQRQMMRRREASGQVTELPGNQQAIMKVLPYLGPVFSFFFPGALALYWVTQSLWRIGQQWYINRSMAAVTATAVVDVEESDGDGARAGRERSGGKGGTPDDTGDEEVPGADDDGRGSGKKKSGTGSGGGGRGNGKRKSDTAADGDGGRGGARRQPPGRRTGGNGAARPASRRTSGRRNESRQSGDERAPRPSKRTGGGGNRRRKR